MPSVELVRGQRWHLGLAVANTVVALLWVAACLLEPGLFTVLLAVVWCALAVVWWVTFAVRRRRSVDAPGGARSD